jgi:hypothetical protein
VVVVVVVFIYEINSINNINNHTYIWISPLSTENGQQCRQQRKQQLHTQHHNINNNINIGIYWSYGSQSVISMDIISICLINIYLLQ